MISEMNSIVSANTSAIYGALKTYSRDFEKLASGSRLNRASDGAAEIAITNLMRSDLASIDQGIRNVRDGVSMLQVADGSLGVVSNNLVRMKELAMQAGNDVYSPEQKRLIQQEFDELASQNVQIGESTKFNGIRLHKDNQVISIKASGEDITAVYTKSIALVTTDLNNTETAIASINNVIDHISSYRASLGSTMNTLEEKTSYLQNQAEEILESVSRIADTDVAATVTSLASNEIVTKHAVAVQAHAQTISQVANLLL